MVLVTLAGWMCLAILLPVSVLAIYQWLLAVAALWPHTAGLSTSARRNKFVILVPAHDEETGLSSTLRSIAAVDYPAGLAHVVVVADRCTDGTAAAARAAGVSCLERSEGTPGKGAAIAWAIDRLREVGANYDALVIVDADTIVDARLLEAYDRALVHGHEVQQGYNYLSNPWETPFTRIIAVTSVLRNGLFYGGKERHGLSSMLSGTGMCFSRRVLERHRWNAFSVGEDWEFSVLLLLNGETIHFTRDARTMARESKGFRQASSQRLRWASGRQAVAGEGASRLVREGVRRRRPELFDAALTLVAPTFSAQATLALFCLGVSVLAATSPSWSFLPIWAAATAGLLAAYFILGVALTEAPHRALFGILLIPAFLPWRLAIEIYGLLGYGRKQWVRTSRLPASR
jgi:1,2-diacylglycerol 3-beta-glucosyltransferase